MNQTHSSSQSNFHSGEKDAKIFGLENFKLFADTISDGPAATVSILPHHHLGLLGLNYQDQDSQVYYVAHKYQQIKTG